LVAYFQETNNGKLYPLYAGKIPWKNGHCNSLQNYPRLWQMFPLKKGLKFAPQKGVLDSASRLEQVDFAASSM
jgi:hypothetical protein